MQQSRGASLGVGLLLGPLGVAANAKAVANKSAEMASGVATSGGLDESAMLKDRVAAAIPSLAVEAAPVMSLAGALLLRVDWDNKVRSSLVVRVTDTSKPKGWSKGYFYHFTHVDDAAKLETDGGATLLNVLGQELDRAVSITTNVILDDLRGQYTEATPVTLSSDFTMPLSKARIAFNGLRIDERDGVTVYHLNGKSMTMQFPTVDGVHLFQAGQYQEQAGR